MIIGMVVFPNLTQLDLTGPYEVFGRLPQTTVLLIAESTGPVISDSGLQLIPDTSFDTAPQVDIIFVPGGKGIFEAMQNQQLLNEINDFSAKAEYFEEARPTMIQLLQTGVAQTLEDAYDKAIRLDSALFDKMQSAQQAQVAAKQNAEKNRAAKAARAAAVSVRGSTPGTNTAPKAHSRRAMLEEAFDESSARL